MQLGLYWHVVLADMTPLLFLVHRIPFPPNKGDKLRSFHLLKSISKYFDVYLGAFVDEPQDMQYKEELSQYCKGMMLVPLNPKTAKIRSLKGFFTGEALSLPYYRSHVLREWSDNIVSEESIEHALIYSSPMAQYISGQDSTIKKKVADFVDIDSDKWRQYSIQHGFVMKWIYRREADKLLEFEKTIANAFDATLFVSGMEKKDFDQYAPESVSKHGFYNNGVDYHYFDPSHHYDNPYEKDVEAITFTGAMDYWANSDAVCWFADKIFPLIKKSYPNVRFYIVGSNPSKEVLALQKNGEIEVTGRVEDIRSYIAHARVLVAPLRIARGIQNKVLEAMAMARPLVATNLALQGIEQCDDYEPLSADSSEDFAKQCLKILNDKKMNATPTARDCVKKHYDWESNLQTIVDLLKAG